MTQTNPTAITIDTHIGATWTSLTNYLMGRISAEWGISGNGPLDFLAKTGTLKFVLDNSSGVFSPDGAAPISADWKKGAPVRLIITALGQTRTWYGRIDDFSFEKDPQHRGKLISVSCVDWMDKTAKYPLNYPDITLEQTADDIVQTIIDALPIAPLEQSLAVGANTFPVAFDTVTDFTRARTEINKVLLSELCYCYVQHEGALGEKLVLENANTRTSPTAKIIPSSDGAFLLKEDGFALLKEDGGKIILDAEEAFTCENNALGYETSFGDNVINDIMFRYIPKRYVAYNAPSGFIAWSAPVQPAPSVAEPGGYNLSINIGAGETKVLNLKYGMNNNRAGYFPDADADRFFENTGENSRLLIAKPFPTSSNFDFQLLDSFSYELATTDISASMVVDSIACVLDKFKLTVTNNHATKRGYLDARLDAATGSSLIIEDPDVPVTIQDSASILAHDHQPLSFDQVYQIDATDGTAFANKVLAAEKSPRTVLNRINLCANKSAYWMNAFMNLDIGDYFPAADTNKGISGSFFVQDMKFTIDPGGIIFFSLGVKESGRQQVAVGTNYSGSAANATTKTLSNVVVTSANNSMILVAIAKRGYNDVTSVARGSQNFTLYHAAEFADGNYPRYEIWQLAAPTPGTADIVVTLPGADWFEVGATVFYNVDQSAPFVNRTETQGTGATAALTVTSDARSIVFDLLSIERGSGVTLTAGAGQIVKMNLSSDNNWAGATSIKTGAASTAMGWTISTSPHNWIYVALSIQGVLI